MGFLNNSTNNIIVDAVLTDKGRQALADNVGSFQISRFAFGDDEIDYTIIKKFGRTVGKEKIEKNTPIFEAQTNADLGVKHRCITLANPFITTLPTLSKSVIGGNATLIRGNNDSASVSIIFSQTQGSGDIESSLIDDLFTVQWDSRFLTVSVGGAGQLSAVRAGSNFINTAVGVGARSNVGGTITLLIGIKAFNNDFYNYYATSPNSNIIKTFVTVTGNSSGASRDQAIEIQKS